MNNKADHQPLTYLDRANRKNARYLFVSYSHSDSERVYRILDRLYKSGVNYWYDVEINVGDVWSDVAQAALLNDDCVGAIVFCGYQFCLSNAIAREVEAINALYEQKKGFFIIPVLLGYETFNTMIAEVFGKNIEDTTISKKTSGVLELFNGDASRIFVKVLSDADCDTVAPIVTGAAKTGNAMNVETVSVRDSGLHRLPLLIRNDLKILELGAYPLGGKDETEKLRWNLIVKTDGLFYFISEYCIDFVPLSTIREKVKAFKAQFADKPYVVDVRVQDEAFIEKYKSNIGDAIPTDYADRQRLQLLRVYWTRVADDAEKHKGVRGGTDEYCLYNARNAQVDRKLNSDKYNAGLRLILVVDDRKIERKNEARDASETR